ncbi:MAG: hypothetical protein JWQ84_2330 [Mucilaginibacter sp.]|jgi:hypothetical protein|nr:hypothetical protein [Mucilaginibacter sp.]MDB5017498.1 hypothetical protein [Mucilaginibacter sp.]MDB5139112.1 hypothetical protein [Mucilaginibacter sp.]
MKKLISMIALAAISFGSVYAHNVVITAKSAMQDTVKKKKMKMKTKTDTTKKKDSTRMIKEK